MSASALLASFPALAQSASTERSYSLEYRAPASCPNAAALRQAIEARTAGAASVDAPQASVRFTLQLAASGETALWVDLAEGSFRREFHAESCTEAIASVAVIAAMVLEAAPAERRALAAFPAEAAASGSGRNASLEPAAAPLGAATAPLPEALPLPLPAFVAPPVVAPVKESPAPSRALGWAALAGGALETAVAPTAPFGFVAGVEAWLARNGWWAPGVRVSLLSTATAKAEVRDGSAELRLLAGRLALCPSRLALAASVRLVPCASFELGSLRGQGGGVAQNPKSAWMLWAAPGASLRGQVDLSAAVAIEAGAAAKVLLWPDHFTFSPSSLVYQVPRASFELGAGVVVRFL